MTVDAIPNPRPNLFMLRPTPEELAEIQRQKREQINKDYCNILIDHFDVRGGDPFDTFICKCCRWEFGQRMYGPFPLDLKVTPIANALHRMKAHLRGCKVFKRGAK